MNEQVSKYIVQAPDTQKEIMEKLRKIIHQNIKGVNEEFKWSRPVFSKEKDFAYFKTAKAYVSVGFFDYNKLVDHDNLLEGTGQNMRHIKIKTPGEINEKLLIEWFKALTND